MSVAIPNFRTLNYRLTKEEIKLEDLPRECFIHRIVLKVKDWLSKPMKDKYVAIFIARMFPTVKEADKVVKKALYVVAGIDTDSYKEILGFWLARQESVSFWADVFNDFKERGEEDILVVVSKEGYIWQDDISKE